MLAATMSARPSPPPLKKSEPPPRPPSLRAVAREEAAATREDDDATEGEWLFKQNDMVLGPVTAIVLVERIKLGELSADTPIARDGQPFKPMKLVKLFREAYEATLERKRREAEEREFNAKVRRARTLRVIIVLMLFLLPAAAGALAGWQVMLRRPWDDTPAWIAKVPAAVDLPPRPIEVKKEPPAPPPVADDGSKDDSAGSDTPDAKDKRIARTPKRGDDKKGDDKKGDDKKDDKPTGFVKELSNEQAVAPLKDGSVRGPLGACLKAEVESNPDMPTTVELAYTITEEGRAINAKLSNRELRGRPVQDCVQKALANARWPRFEGERKNVSVPFTIKKPAKPATGPVTGGAPK